ncbi:MAG: proteasome assembly chaperone family protein [Candidatus Zipacnadales bacterium]
MAAEELEIRGHPSVSHPPLVMGLTGWMDGGSVSTGTIGYLVDRLDAHVFAEIRPFDFYILNFPLATVPLSIHSEEGKAILTAINPMEVAAIFRPHTRIKEGVIEELRYPSNEFFAAESANLLLFSGEEPHIRWGAYSDCLFALAERFGVREICFVGSVAAPLPHTREPRMTASMGDASLRERLSGMGIGLANYRGPASLITSLCYHAAERGIEMRSLVVEVPHYPFIEMPAYPRSILKATAALNTLFDLQLDLSDLERAAKSVEERLNAVMEENDSFRQLVQKLEAVHDREELGEDAELLKRLIDSINLGGDGEPSETNEPL